MSSISLLDDLESLLSTPIRGGGEKEEKDDNNNVQEESSSPETSDQESHNHQIHHRRNDDDDDDSPFTNIPHDLFPVGKLTNVPALSLFENSFALDIPDHTYYASPASSPGRGKQKDDDTDNQEEQPPHGQRPHQHRLELQLVTFLADLMRIPHWYIEVNHVTGVVVVNHHDEGNNNNLSSGHEDNVNRTTDHCPRSILLLVSPLQATADLCTVLRINQEGRVKLPQVTVNAVALLNHPTIDFPKWFVEEILETAREEQHEFHQQPQQQQQQLMGMQCNPYYADDYNDNPRGGDGDDKKNEEKQQYQRMLGFCARIERYMSGDATIYVRQVELLKLRPWTTRKR